MLHNWNNSSAPEPNLFSVPLIVIHLNKPMAQARSLLAASVAIIVWLWLAALGENILFLCVFQSGRPCPKHFGPLIGPHSIVVIVANSLFLCSHGMQPFFAASAY
ncbi:hypothetical protein Ddc_07645 [Ditylenchus destructor]|nr:hypothetical protein Ddc_07645 [Ditylenchus destructor]